MYKVTVKVGGNSYVFWCSTLEEMEEIQKKYSPQFEVSIQVWS